MHIAIEGLDGAGKTETAKLVAAKLGLEFIEKPLHFITDEHGMENYFKIIERVNANEDKHFRARFYGTGNYLVSRLAQKGKVITDRHLVSNYYWNSDADHDLYFDELVKKCGRPDITFVLYVSSRERKRRILSRNPEDPDLKRKVFSDEPYIKIKDFLEKYKMPYEMVDATKMSLTEVVEYVCNRINTIVSEKNLGREDNR